MAAWNSMVRGHIEAIRRHMGWDPTDIVGEGNLVPSMQNRNAYSGIPAGPPPTQGDQSNIGVPKYEEASEIPSTKGKGGDPYAGMGNF